ncbi:MAG: queuosine salvage family protein [Actinomycetota bacterium]|nr:queuosine salvage family protein [Actinomycetota bacterium]
MDIATRIRASCRQVANLAAHVRIDTDRIADYAGELPVAEWGTPAYDAEHHFRGGTEDTVGYVLCLDSINFGSGWFPALRKRPGMSGYFTVSTALKDRFERDGAFSPAELTALTADHLADLLGQNDNPAVDELMVLFAGALNDFGRWLTDRFNGRYSAVPEQAAGSAVALAGLLTEMPLFNDTADYHGRQVLFGKRAQLTAVDLSLAFDGQGPGRFTDLHRLTIFADNLVPHVLRTDGVLRYDAELADAIDSAALLAPGSDQELEIRACAVHAVELLAEQFDGAVTAADLDYLLWNRGQQQVYRDRPRHRTRTTNY